MGALRSLRPLRRATALDGGARQIHPESASAQTHQLLGSPMVTQIALAEFMATGGYERHLRNLRRTYAQLIARMTDAVARYFPAGTRVTRPQGGHLLWVELPGECRCADIASPGLGGRDQHRSWADLLCPTAISKLPGGSIVRIRGPTSWNRRCEAGAALATGLVRA